MKKQMIQFKKNAIKLAFGTLLMVAAGASQINAQTVESSARGGKNEIPSEFLSATAFNVNKTANPVLAFDAATPYFKELNIVDGTNKPLQSVIATDRTDANNNIVKREFNFSAVTPGTYFAKGMLTGTLVYYQIEVNN